MRERHTKSFYMLLLKLVTAALKKWPAERENSGFSASLPLSCAKREWGVDLEPSLCVAAIRLTAVTKIKFLIFKEMPKQDKMTAAKST